MTIKHHSRRDSDLLATALDEAHVLDDYLRSVVALTDGKIGGLTEAGSGWRKVFGWTRTGGQDNVVRGMAGQFGGAQLEKAARQAGLLASAVAELTDGATTAPARAAGDAARELGVDTFQRRLGDPALSVRSPELRSLYGDLGKVIARFGEARTKVILAEMREQ